MFKTVLSIARVKIRLEMPVPFKSDSFIRILGLYGIPSGNCGSEFVLRVLDDFPLVFPAGPCEVCCDVRTAVRGKSIYFDSSLALCRYDSVSQSMVVTVKCRDDDCRDRVVLSCLRHLMAIITVNLGGMPFHCSAAMKNGRCLVFSGPSGSGKSTIARLLAGGWEIFSDEYNILMPEGGTWIVYSTPFTNPVLRERCVNGRGTVHALFSLGERGDFEIQPMSAAEKFRFCASGAYVLPYSPDFSRVIFENAGNLGRHERIMKLRFHDDKRTADHINAFMEFADDDV